MEFDRRKFFDAYAAAFGTMRGRQVDGLDDLLTAAESDAEVTDIRRLAYMLATVKHECADTFQPIEEYGKGAGRSYGKPVTVTDPQGNSHTHAYYGRGYVQLTWRANYEKMGLALGNRLLYEPALALDPEIAYRILSLGMRNGFFTGKKLGDYIAGQKCDYVNARRIINGLDRAELIAGYARKFEWILRASAAGAGEDVQPPAQPAVPGPLFTVTAGSLNVRNGPGASNPTVTGSPLRSGTLVRGLEERGGWEKVVVEGIGKAVTGWVSTKYLRPVPPARQVA